MRAFYFFMMLIGSASIAMGSKWTILEWQYWVFIFPVACWFGVVSSLASRD